MNTYLAAGLQPAGLSVGGAVIGLTGAALLGGIAFGMHRRGKSARIIGWICFLIGIPLAGLLSGLLANVTGLTLWSIPVLLVVTGYVAFVFFHDGIKKFGGRPHKHLQPLFGLLLPVLLLSLGGGLGNGFHALLSTVDHGTGTVLSRTTGQ